MSRLSRFIPTRVKNYLDHIALRLSTYWHVTMLESCYRGLKEDLERFQGTECEKYFDLPTFERLKVALHETLDLYDDCCYEEARARAIAGYEQYTKLSPEHRKHIDPPVEYYQAISQRPF